MVFRCAKCGVEITGRVEQTTDRTLLRMGDEVNVVPAGKYVGGETFRAWNRSEFGADWNGIPEDEYVLNLDDLRNTKHGGRLVGCCGLDGLDGINTFCTRGHPIGTELSDCWTPRFIHIPPQNVALDDENERRTR